MTRLQDMQKMSRIVCWHFLRFAHSMFRCFRSESTSRKLIRAVVRACLHPFVAFLLAPTRALDLRHHHEVEVEEQNFPFFTFYNKKHKKWQKIKTPVYVPAFNFTSSFGFSDHSASTRELHCIQPGFLSSTRIKSKLAWGNEANLKEFRLDWGDQARRPQRIRAG